MEKKISEIEKKISKMDVFVCRGIWYLVTLPSLFGLSKSLNLLWPRKDLSSGYLRDGAVSATTFYAVTLLRYLFFTAPPSTCYKVFTTQLQRLPQVFFSLLSINLAFGMPAYYELLTTKKFRLPMSLFTTSLFTGGIGLIQLSGKFRMEIGHAFATLFLGWLFCLFALFDTLWSGDDHELLFFLCIPLFLLSLWLVSYNLSDEEGSDSFSASRLPT